MKLSKAVKEQLIKDMVSNKFQQQHNQLDLEHKAMAKEVYDKIIGSHASMVKVLPANFFSQGSSFNLVAPCSSGEGTVRYQFNLEQTERLPACLESWKHYQPEWPKDHPLWQALRAHFDRKRQLNNSRQQLRKALNEALTSISTDKQLKELLPEAEPFLRKQTAPDNTSALAVSMQQVRELLNA